MNTNETEITKENKDPKSMTNLVVILLALIFLGLAAVMLFVPDIELKPEYLCYVVGGAVVIAGIVQIVRYFITDAYKNMNEYGFSIGTLCVILGICILLRAGVIGGVIDLFLGCFVLLMGVVMLQHSLDLRRMGDVMWGLVIVLAAISMVCGVGLILKPSPDKIAYASYIWWIVLIVSAVGLLVNIYTMIRVAVYKHKEKKKAETAAPSDTEPAGVVETVSTTDTEPAGTADTQSPGTSAESVVSTDSTLAETVSGSSYSDETVSGSSESTGADIPDTDGADPKL